MSDVQVLDGKHGIFEMSGDAKILANHIVKRLITDKAECLTYDEMSTVISQNILEHRSVMYSAKKHVEQHHKVLIDTVKKVGIKLTADYVGASSNIISRIGRMSRKTCSRINKAMSGDHNIPDDQLIAVNARLSLLGVINMSVKPSLVKRIEGRVSTTLNQLPTMETLKMFEK